MKEQKEKGSIVPPGCAKKLSGIAEIKARGIEQLLDAMILGFWCFLLYIRLEKQKQLPLFKSKIGSSIYVKEN